MQSCGTLISTSNFSKMLPRCNTCVIISHSDDCFGMVLLRKLFQIHSLFTNAFSESTESSKSSGNPNSACYITMIQRILMWTVQEESKLACELSIKLSLFLNVFGNEFRLYLRESWRHPRQALFFETLTITLFFHSLGKISDSQHLRVSAGREIW